MSDINDSAESKKQEHCFECPAGFEECLECGACDHCEHDAALDENELPPNWLRFIENNKGS
ncbi:MAG: hypothetical protein KAJ31_00225 [Deltaproteobacteria bacterium]|nr:hypothetical protein [Deltaproteobacteria bacterium]MCK5710903.1 hypothetical protein [Deltaproteobacteria bacterium]